MRFSLIFFIFISSQLICQTFFIKYKSEKLAEKSVSNFQNSITGINSQKGNIKNQEIIRISSFKKEFGNLNNNLNKIVKVKISDDSLIKDFISQLKLDPNIEYIHQAVTLKIDQIQEDSLFSEQWGLNSVNAIKAWDLLENVDTYELLAVIDTGIDYFHPDLKNNIFINNGEQGLDAQGRDKATNGIDDDENGFIDDYRGWDFVNKIDIFPIEPEFDFTDWDNDPFDENEHGTNISGIIAAEHNTIGIAGLIPNVKILNIRAFDKNGEGQEDDAASAIIYAVKMGAKVINMSWGDNQYSQLLKDVIEYAYENKVVLVGSAGNSSSDEPHYPSSFSEVISVGAIQENEVLASFSNFGSTIDLVAPGSQIITLGLNNSYKKVSGTSASAPFVSAAAAMILSVKDFSNEEVKQILKSTTKDLGDTGWDEKYGVGNLNILKAISILSPSTIKFNFPKQNYHTYDNSLEINITCLTPYFKDFQLFYGIGFNPEKWENIETGKENYQLLNENIFNLNIANFIDTSYTLRLLVNRVDNNTLEERVNFFIDRTPPEILNYNYFPAMLNEKEILQASVITNEPTNVKLYYRNNGLISEFKFLYLDGFNGDLRTYSKTNFGMLPINEQISGFDFEFYFEAENEVGLITTINDNGNNFYAKNNLVTNLVSKIEKDYILPNGRIFNSPVNLKGINEKFVFINENETSSDLSIFKINNNQFEKINILKNRIPVSVGDFNNDDITDILSLFVKNGFIESQISSGSLEFQNVFSDSSQKFWPAYADDIDSDNLVEIIVFSSDTTITIWEVDENFSLRIEAELNNFFNDNSINKSIFRNNNILVADFDNDQKNEIVTFDNFGRLIIYKINGINSYSNYKIMEHFFPIESNINFAKGDFNGDGKIDIAVLMEFENNVFGTPLIYNSVFSLNENEVELLFQNMFVSTENSFTSSFEKQYKTIELVDLNEDNKDELIIFTYPNAYIFNYTEKAELIFYQTDVNSQSIFLGDLDENGISEIGIPKGNSLHFYEFIDDGKISPPVITDYYSLDSNLVYFEWNNNDYPVLISRFDLDSAIDKPKFDTVKAKSFTDKVEPNKYYEYFVEYFDIENNTVLSNKSNEIKVFSHAPGVVKGVDEINNKSIEITFSQPIMKKEVRINHFHINDSEKINSVSTSSQYSYVITFSEALSIGEHSLSIKSLRDFYNTPIKDTTIIFEITESLSERNTLFIINYEIIDNYNLSVIFNLSLDSLTVLNKNNYIFTPNNLLESISFAKNSLNKLILTTKKPFGAIGREYVLKIQNIFSSIETGKIPISENSGSEIVLTTNANNLDNIYVYPNPVNVTRDEKITFANLTKRVDIYIFSIDGIFIKKLEEDDGNGGIDWNLLDKNNREVSSGVYFYRAISLDNFDNKLQEKIGKFAVIK